MKLADLVVGKKVGHFTIVGERRYYEKVTRSGVTRKVCMFPVECICGTKKEVLGTNLSTGLSKSCGCNGDPEKIHVNDTETFIRASKRKYGEFFDYSQTVYVNYDTDLKIIDPEFGLFYVKPSRHLKSGVGQGHPERGKKNRIDKKIIWTAEKIKDKALDIYGDTYDLSRISKPGSETRFEVGCPKHGWWETSAREFVLGSKSGCPTCRLIQLPIGFTKERLKVIRSPYNIRKISASSNQPRNERVVDVQCDCGKTIEAMLVGNFIKESVKSCGCLAREKAVERGKETRSVFPGDRFGWLTVLDESQNRKRNNGSNNWYDKVRCSCGTKFWARRNSLPSGNTQSCTKCGKRRSGLKQRLPISPGERFGKLTVIRPWGSEEDGSSLSLVRCGCSRQEIVREANLKSGNTSSCQTCRTRKFTSDRDREEQYPIGFRANRLVVLRHWGRGKGSQQRVLCQCDCGSQHIADVGHIYYPGSNQYQYCPSCNPSSGSESVERFLDDQEWAESSCEFYVAAIDEQYIKPGIAADYDKRIDDRYRVASTYQKA